MKADTCYQFFVTLANKLKINIVISLLEKPMTVTQICKELDVEQSKISHALKILYLCRIVEFKQEGKLRIYSLNKETIVPLLKIVEKHEKSFCKMCHKRCKK